MSRPRHIERILGAAGRGDFKREDAIVLREYITQLEEIISTLRKVYGDEL